MSKLKALERLVLIRTETFTIRDPGKKYPDACCKLEVYRGNTTEDEPYWVDLYKDFDGHYEWVDAFNCGEADFDSIFKYATKIYADELLRTKH